MSPRVLDERAGGVKSPSLADVDQNDPRGNHCHVDRNEPRSIPEAVSSLSPTEQVCSRELDVDGRDLFIHLLLSLRHFADAAVLWVLLKERADVKEFTTTSMLMSHVQLSGVLDRNAAKRSFKSLQEQSLIHVRIHRKTATLVKVDRAAVLQLLRRPLDGRLPGLSAKLFPFLDAWSEERGRCSSGIPSSWPDVDASPRGLEPVRSSSASEPQGGATPPPLN
ncbi:hypothetical protein DES41_111144 [Pseudorhodoferax soli]|uniref:Uncharacterized protein n=1 Tax=Pseudorhodoferax soli TaxID=545864 RepID=A0A368XG62_9BURK|nr:hypothetical protein DES41_111144 [Pseudorhodoferax soli]